jgi:hypothetical protein
LDIGAFQISNFQIRDVQPAFKYPAREKPSYIQALLAEHLVPCDPLPYHNHAELCQLLRMMQPSAAKSICSCSELYSGIL